MCDPVTIGVTLAVASSAATIAQQQGASRAQNEYEELAYKQRKAAAAEDVFQLRQREIQEQAKAAQEIRRVTSQARQAGAAAKLQALETGTGGQSVTALLDTFERGELANVGVVKSNLAAVQQQIRAQELAAGRITGPAKSFGPLDSGIGIAASTLQVGSSAFNAYQATKPPTA